MKLRMRLYKRKNGFWYYEVQRNEPRSLRTKNEREANASSAAYRWAR